MTDHDLDRELEDLRKDDGSHLGSVQSRVMAQVRSEARRRRMATWISLATAAAALAIAFRIPWPTAPLESLESKVASPAPPAMAFVAPVDPRPVSASYRPRKQSTITAKDGPLEVRMQTDDPDVLIIWLVDEEGQQEGKKGTP